jgi:hypothetical protein
MQPNEHRAKKSLIYSQYINYSDVYVKYLLFFNPKIKKSTV